MSSVPASLPGDIVAQPTVRSGEPANGASLPAADSTAEMDSAMSASERLTLTRSRLRTAMVDMAHPPQRPSLLDARVRPAAEAWLRKARELPGAALALDSVRGWWEHHPLRTGGVVVEAASRQLVRPIAERRPKVLVLGAAAFGALLVFSRPWRWILRPALFLGLLPQLTTQVIKRVPVENWVGMATALLTRSGAARSLRRDIPSSPWRPE